MAKLGSGSHRLRVWTSKDLHRIPQVQCLDAHRRLVMRAVSQVFPFRVNQYVIEKLIDWRNIPEDPIFQLTFPQPDMLAPADLKRMTELCMRKAPEAAIRFAARHIQWGLNPNPAGQKLLNVPRLDGKRVAGIQHKYRETVLLFPLPAQTCHTYCTYCFRWPQFCRLNDTRFVNKCPDQLARYIGQHPEVASVLLTGGDPMVMRTRVLRRFVEPLLDIEHVSSVRIGTKAPAWWPHRFVTDSDADDLLRLFEQVVSAGKHLALMAHYSHGRELEPDIARQAVRRIRSTGAVVRCQAPVVRHVNDDPRVWTDLWRAQVSLGAVPYYMFVERDTGARRYFEVSLARALAIYRAAYASVSGLARTARGPSMSATPGKILVDDVVEVAGQRLFVLKFLQAREPKWTGRVFFAHYNENATWIDQLKPAFGERHFFYESFMRELVARAQGRRLRLVNLEAASRQSVESA